VNQGPFDASKWKYGHAFDAPEVSKIWNPVKLKMMTGGKVTGGTLFASTDPAIYCAMANAGYDFIWTEMQHNERDWSSVGRMWRTCPTAKAVPGVRVAYTDEREIQHAVDAGALVVVVPTVDTVEEAIETGTGRIFRHLKAQRRRSGIRQPCGAMCRAVIRLLSNLVLILMMIETLEGLKNADAIAKLGNCGICRGGIRNFRTRKGTQTTSEQNIVPRPSKRDVRLAARSHGGIVRIFCFRQATKLRRFRALRDSILSATSQTGVRPFAPARK
jgi:2-keto-3-deoxy-L-rhamnonate aldolase RhmA